MSHPIRRVTNIFVSLLLAVMSISIIGAPSSHASILAMTDPSKTQVTDQSTDQSLGQQTDVPQNQVPKQDEEQTQKTVTPTVTSPLAAQAITFCLPICGELPSTPIKSSPIDECGTTNDELKIDAAPGVIYTPSKLDSGILSKLNCPTTPLAPQFVDPCGIANDSYTIPEVDGVEYLVKEGRTGTWHEVSKGTYVVNGADKIKIKTVAKDGYQLVGRTKWHHMFTDAKCPTPCERGLIPALSLGREVNNDDCNPGMGGGGNTGGTPSTPPTPVTPTTPITQSTSTHVLPAITTSMQKAVRTPSNIVLPETGAHPLVQAFTLFIAGILTYGAMFFLVNGRHFADKK